MTNDFIHWLPKETRRKLRGRDIQVETESAKKRY
nr:MAG TPA: Histone chaperone [Caudoviricetes sp.]